MSNSSNLALVKKVLSGDAVILCGIPQGGPPWVKTFIFSHVKSPQLANPELNVGEDEPCGFLAREFTRKSLIGEKVNFTIDKVLGDFSYGSVKLESEKYSFTHQLLSSGMATLIDTLSIDDEIYQELSDAEELAKIKNLGVWNETIHMNPQNQIAIHTVDDIHSKEKIYDKYGNQPFEVIIEDVINPGCFEVLIPSEMIKFNIQLCGLLVEKNNFSDEAKFFVEIRLLNRQVKVQLHTYTQHLGLLATVYHPQGNMSCLLLSNGFVKIDQTTLSNVEKPETYIECMMEAKKLNRRIWKHTQNNAHMPSPPIAVPVGATISPPPNLAQTPSPSKSTSSTTAFVLDATSGDSFQLLCNTSTSFLGQAKSTCLVRLAGIRTARLDLRQNIQQPPWAYEAFEFVRKEVVGKNVTVIHEHSRMPVNTPNFTNGSKIDDKLSPNNPQNAIVYVQIYTENGTKNISELLVKNGLAKLNPLRKNETPPMNYNALLELEKEAKENKLGLHGNEEGAIKFRVNDLSTLNKAKNIQLFLNELRESSPMDGYPRYISSANHFKIFLPSKNLIIWFIVTGVQIYRPSTNSAASNYDVSMSKINEEAVLYTKKTLLQRDIKVVVEGCTNAGHFLGKLYFKKKANFAIQLIQMGYGFYEENFNNTGREGEMLKAAESEAKSKMRGYWSIEQPTYTNGESNHNKSTILENSIYKRVSVSHINSLKNFFVQNLENEEILSKICNELNHIDNEKDTHLNIHTHPKRIGEVIIARFTGDDLWYRALIRKWLPNDQCYDLFYLEYGNSEILSAKRTKLCPQNILNLPPQAISCSLAGIISDRQMEDEAAQYFHNYTDEGEFECVLQQELKKDNFTVILYEIDQSLNAEKISVNESIVATGWARVDHSHPTSIMPRLESAEEHAKKNHLNIWRYGNLSLDEDFD